MNSICRRLKNILVSPFTWGIIALLIGYWLNYIDAILCTIFTSIPESCITVIAILALLKKRNLIDIYFLKDSIKNVMIPALPVALLSDIMQYIFHFNQYITFISTEILMVCLIIYLIKKTNILDEEINYIKIIIYVVTTDFVMIFLTEGFYAIIVTLVLNKTMIEISSNVWLIIVLSLVPRLIQILVLTLYFYKNSFQEKISYVEIIFKNKVLSISTMIFLISALIGGIIIVRFLVETNILKSYELMTQILIPVLVLSLPSILVSSYIISICSLINNNIKLQKEKENLYDDDII